MRESPGSSTPLCSIVVPVYNGRGVIERCLNALASQTLARCAVEIIVVDDGSTDDTPQRIEAWAQGHPDLSLVLARQQNAGPASARNHGARLAHAPLLLFTDADCAPEPGWAAALLGAFAEADVVGAKGAYLSDQRDLVPRFVQAEYEDRYDRMRGQERIDFIDTYAAAYRREIFLENGGFDATFTTASVEDQEFSFRLAQKGYRMVFVPEARVRHIHDESLRDYVRRKYYIGFWKALLTRRHPERMVQDSHTPQVLKAQIVLSALVVGLLPFCLAAIFLPILRPVWVIAAGVALVFAASSLPFLGKLARRSWLLALAGLPMLAARALALGGGYLAGTIHFAGTLHFVGTRAHLEDSRWQPVIPGWKRMVKRGIDIAGALVGLVVSIPIVAVAAIAIKLDSPGPIFYRQVRIGEHGRPFRIIKLRSMVADADRQVERLVNFDELPEPVFKLADDPRVTRVGRVLRRMSLDETPQFINVLLGDMSLVGPRPEEERVVALYADYQRRRLAVKPGVTGPMQVNGRGTLTLAERLRLELDYIENYSLRRDMEILWQTFPAIWRGTGAF